MSRHRLARFRPAHPWSWRWVASAHRRLTLLVILMLVVASAALFVTVPLAWMNQRLRRIAEPFAYRSYEQLHWIESAWTAPVLPPAFIRGDEPEVAAWLAREPVLVALTTLDGSQAWIREGTRLVRRVPCPEPYQQWIKEATKAPEDRYNPEIKEGGTALVLRGRAGCSIRRWRIGSPDVEAFLRQTLGPDPLIRAGLRRRSFQERPAIRTTEAWSLPPNIQTAFSQEKPSMMDPASGRGAFGEGWELAAVPGPSFESTLQAVFRRSRNEALVLLAFILSLWALAWHLHRRSRARERAEGDRLASLTHSLKTPLAVLKLRCDTLRLGNLSRDAAEAQFLHLGEEVDQLSHLIDQALKGFGTARPQTAREPLTRDWIEAIVDDLHPAFDSAGRTLVTDLVGLGGWAHRPSLRTALVTLLENALLHGSGTVSFSAQTLGRRTRFTILNEAPDLEAGQISQLGRPFYRIRSRHAEGFQQEGHGLGLFLLNQVALQEGWGLELRSQDGHFEACLDIHATT